MIEQNLPNFILVGFQRTGTTWLYEVLKTHPDVFLPYVKELHFFDRNFDKGIDWYTKYYEDHKNQKCIGDITPNYIHDIENASRIYNLIPDTKILIILRNPIDYLYSLYNHMKVINSGISDFESFINDKNILRLGLYFEKIRAYYQLFETEQIYITYYDEFINDSENYVRNICDFLAINPDLLTADLNRVVNQSVVPRFKYLHKFAHQLVLFSRSIESKPLHLLHKRIRPLLNNKFYMKEIGSKRINNEAEIAYLRNYYYKDISLVSDLLEKDLISYWGL